MMNSFSYSKIISILSGNSFVVLSTFIIASILVTKSSLEDYGYFITIQSILISLSILCKPCTWVSIVTYREEQSIYNLAKFSLTVELFSSFLIGVIIYLTSYYIEHKFLNFIYDQLLLVILFIFTYNSGCFLGVFRALEKYGVISLFLSISALVKIIFSLFLYNNINKLLLFFIITDIVMWLVAMCYALYYSSNLDTENKKVNFFKLSFIKTSFTSYVNQALDLPITQLDRVVVSFIVGEQSAAVFNLLRRLSSLLNQIGEPLYQIYVRQFSTKDFNPKNLDVLSMTIFSLKKIGIPIGLSFIFYPLIIPYVDMLMFNGNLSGYYLTLFLFLLVTSFSIIFVWINPLYFLHVSQVKTIGITFLSNLIYILSLLVIFNFFTIYASFVCILLQVSVNYSIKMGSVFKMKNFKSDH